MTQILTLNHVLATRGLNGKDLAHSLGKTESTVSRWRGGLKPSEESRRLIITELELTKDEIAALGWAEEPTHA